MNFTALKLGRAPCRTGDGTQFYKMLSSLFTKLLLWDATAFCLSRGFELLFGCIVNPNMQLSSPSPES